MLTVNELGEAVARATISNPAESDILRCNSRVRHWCEDGALPCIGGKRGIGFNRYFDTERLHLAAILGTLANARVSSRRFAEISKLILADPLWKTAVAGKGGLSLHLSLAAHETVVAISKTRPKSADAIISIDLAALFSRLAVPAAA